MARLDLKTLLQKIHPVVHSAVESAVATCVARTNYDIEIEHVLLALAGEPKCDFSLICSHFGIELASAEEELNHAIDELKTGSAKRPGLSPSAIDLIRDAWYIASLECQETKIRSGHLAMALVQERRHYGIGTELFVRIPSELLKEELPTICENSLEKTGSVTTSESPEATKRGSKALDQYTIDLTEQAREGKIDPIVGRDHEIRQIIDILSRRRQNNPIITGDAGVGKTAVVEGFAQYIASGDVPPQLKDVAVKSLDLALLQAGAGVRGEFENRLKSVIEEVKSSPKPIILFVDEAHNLIGTGGQAGQGDAANLLKPALARGELRTIAATTWAEYKKYFEQDPALARRFQVVNVDEPDEETAIRMMQGIVETLENHHKVRISNEAVEEAVKLSKRYISGRQLPDKAVSLLDTTCARINLSQTSTPGQIEDVKRSIQQLETKIRILGRQSSIDPKNQVGVQECQTEIDSLAEQQVELETRWKKELDLVNSINGLYSELGEVQAGTSDVKMAQTETLSRDIDCLEIELRELQGEMPLVHVCCNGAAIAETVGAWTGIPVGKMVADEVKTILNLDALMEQNVVGQSHAVEQICESIKTSRAKLTDPGRPIGVFLLAGTSGVGKTETALTLANLLYGGDQNLTVINMSEFKEEHKVSLLMGSPPGYVGSEKGGVLTEAVRRKPYSVVLLDELEKAHPGVQEIFYQVFDKGYMMDGTGRLIDFKNTLIIMTSNAGTDLIKKVCADPNHVPSAASLHEALFDELLKDFKPAFLGRLTVIPYFPLNDEVLKMIAKLKLNKIVKRVVSNYNAQVDIDDEVVNAIVARCTEVDTGARNIDKIIDQTLLPDLSVLILEKMAQGGEFDRVKIGMNAENEFDIKLMLADDQEVVDHRSVLAKL